MSAPSTDRLLAFRSASAPYAGNGRDRLDAAQWQRFEGYAREILTAFGMAPDTPGTRDTPRRFLRALYDATSGYDGDPNLVTTFPAESRDRGGSHLEQVIEGPVAFHALCEHHALPFSGTVHIGYVPAERIIGISKLTRLIRLHARRFTVQERLGAQVADALAELVDPHGVAVRVEAHHLCVQLRGVAEQGARTRTTVWRGCYENDADLRREFLG